MGVYLSSPVVEKESINKDCPEQGFCYGASSMQGWRTTQEDAHNCIPVFDEKSGTSFFAVYDGHGGSEVAKYCELHFPDFVKALFETGADLDTKPTQSIQSAFLAFDATLTSDDVIKELKSLSGKEDDMDDEDDDNMVGYSETDLLKEEASMPLEKVLAKYSDGQPNLNQENNPGASSSSQDSSSSTSVNKDTPGKGPESSHVSTNNNCSSGGSSSASNSETPTSAVESGPSGSGSATGIRSSKAKASVDIAKSGTAPDIDADDDNDDDDDDDDDDEEEDEDEDAWEDTSDEDDEEEEVGQDGDIPMMDTTDEEPGADSGCTACVLFKQGCKLVVANAGDSRCVLSRAGQAIDLSWDHKPEDEPELTRIEAAGGKVTADGRVNGGLNLSRAIGDHVYKRNTKLPARDQMITALPDVHIQELNSQDQFIVLACDGIWNSLSSQEVVDYVLARLKHPEKRKQPALICEELFDHCLAHDTSGDGTGCDNMTCIIIILDNFHSSDSNGEGQVTTAVVNTGHEKDISDSAVNSSVKRQTGEIDENSSHEKLSTEVEEINDGDGHAQENDVVRQSSESVVGKNGSSKDHHNTETADPGVEDNASASLKRCADNLESGEKKRVKLEGNVV